MENKMFCYQCEQTAGCTGCTGNTGVCGKSANTARLQDELTGALIGLARATEGNEQLVTEEMNQLVLEGLFTTITNVNFNDETLKLLIDKIEDTKKKLVPNCFTCSDSCGRNNNFDMSTLWTTDEDIRSLKSFILLEFVEWLHMHIMLVCLDITMKQSANSSIRHFLQSE